VNTGADIKNSDYCEVIGGTHKGKSSTIEDRRTSKTGAVTITVRLADDDRVKTPAKNAVLRKPKG